MLHFEGYFNIGYKNDIFKEVQHTTTTQSNSSHFQGGAGTVMLSSFFEVRFFKIRTTYRVGCCAQCSINSLNKTSIIKFYLLKKTANIQIYVELNITGGRGG